ncbi:MAG TPA: hypothetical protein VNE62_11210 [Actinomycetota bacterium]|nr:hypothetical protein [Actinomycetota bacterium]
MKALRTEEEWARQVMSYALGVPVLQHDDGSVGGMYDLDVVYDGETAAAEVISAADGESIALWNLMNGRDETWVVDELQGGWMVSLESTARAKRLRTELPRLLQELEMSGLTGFRRGRTSAKDQFSEVAHALGVASAMQNGTDVPGSIYITIQLPRERAGGFLADTGDALPAWVAEFLRAPKRRDVLDKLARSGRSERHAFVFLPGFAEAPFGVTDLLMRNSAPLPLANPQLPDEVTHVWLVSGWSSGRGFRWSPTDGWSFFDKLQVTAA